MKLKIKAGTTSKRVKLFISDATSSIGGGLSGLAFNTPSLQASYIRDGEASVTSIPLGSGVLGTYSPSGFIEADVNKMPGVYEFGVPNTVLAAGANCAHLFFHGANNMVPCPVEIELDAIDYQTQIPDQILSASISGWPGGGTVGSGLFALSQNIYFADIELIQDSLASQDEYGVQWFRNSQPISSGQISNPSFSVYDGQTGTALLSNRILNYSSPNLGILTKTETTLTASGVPYLIIASGIIDNGVRVWQNVVGKE